MSAPVEVSTSQAPTDSVTTREKPPIASVSAAGNREEMRENSSSFPCWLIIFLPSDDSSVPKGRVGAKTDEKRSLRCMRLGIGVARVRQKITTAEDLRNSPCNAEEL